MIASDMSGAEHLDRAERQCEAACAGIWRKTLGILSRAHPHLGEAQKQILNPLMDGDDLHKLIYAATFLVGQRIDDLSSMQSETISESAQLACLRACAAELAGQLVSLVVLQLKAGPVESDGGARDSAAEQPDNESRGPNHNPNCPVPKTILTTGCFLRGGQAFDLAQDGNFVYWNGEHTEIRPAVVREQGCVYRVPRNASTLCRSVILPTDADKCTIEELVADLATMTENLGFDSGTSLLISTAVLGGWVWECLPGRRAPALVFWGPSSNEDSVLELMNAVCRRPIRMVDPSPGTIAALKLSPTVILVRPRRNVLLKLAHGSGAAVQHRGRLLTGNYSVVAFAEQPLEGAWNVPLIPTALQAFTSDAEELEDASRKLQRRLLYYRFTQHRNVARSTPQVTQFTPSIRRFARMSLATVAGSSELQERVLQALRRADEQARAADTTTCKIVVLEALVALCRANRARAFVGEMTEVANTILLGRHETATLTSQAAGRVISSFGLHVGDRRARGYPLVLDKPVEDRIYALAAAYGDRAHGVERSTGSTPSTRWR